MVEGVSWDTYDGSCGNMMTINIYAAGQNHTRKVAWYACGATESFFDACEEVDTRVQFGAIDNLICRCECRAAGSELAAASCSLSGESAYRTSAVAFSSALVLCTR
jgi:hypothetical protein